MKVIDLLKVFEGSNVNVVPFEVEKMERYEVEEMPENVALLPVDSFYIFENELYIRVLADSLN